ncbi:MAG: ABC transporter permease subunit [Vulcanibacillus sp.]
MNIYIHELKMLRNVTIYWTIALVAVLILFMSIYPAVSTDAASFQELLDSFPEGFQEALGISNFNFATVLGYYSFTLIYIFLMGYIQAMNYGASSVSIELSQNTADFLFAKPVKRINILTYKILAIITCLLFTNLIYGITTFAVLNAVSSAEYDLMTLILINFSLFLVQLLFVSLGLFVAVFLKKLKSVLPLTLGFVFGFFIINLLNESLDDVKLTFLTPFAYFTPTKIIINRSYDLTYLLLTLFLILLFTITTYLVYHKKDIPSI